MTILLMLSVITLLVLRAQCDGKQTPDDTIYQSREDFHLADSTHCEGILRRNEKKQIIERKHISTAGLRWCIEIIPGWEQDLARTHWGSYHWSKPRELRTNLCNDGIINYGTIIFLNPIISVFIPLQ